MNRYNYPRVVNEMNSTNLKSFKILGLFGRYDVELPFDKQVNIFIGENGLGKTTILNCLYYVLQKKYSQLENLPFQQIEISFRNTSVPITISKADVISYNQRRKGRRIVHDEDYFDCLLSELQITPKLRYFSIDEWRLNLII
jgi:AAA15 family ATPase/GTPase